MIGDSSLEELQQLIFLGQNEAVLAKSDSILRDEFHEPSPITVKALIFKTIALMRMGKFKNAERVGREAIIIAKKLQDPVLIIDASLTVAETLWQQGKLSNALTIVRDCEKTLDLSRFSLHERNILVLKGKISFHQAVINQKKGSAREALSFFQEARKLLENGGDIHHLARCMNGMGLVFWNTGKMELARECFETARKHAEQIQDLYSMAYSHNNMAIYYRYKGDLEAALDQLKKSRELWEKMSNQHGIATTLINMGEILQEMREFQEARKLYEQSLSLFDQVGDEINTLVALEALAENHRKTGNLVQYREVLESIIRIAERKDLKNNLSKACMSMARMYLDMGDLSQVDQYLNRFEALLDVIGDNIDVLEYLRLRAAVAWARNDQLAALEFLEKRLQLSRKLSNPQEIVKSLHEMLVGYLSLGEHDIVHKILDEINAITREHPDDNFIRVVNAISRALHLNSLPKYVERVKALAYVDEVIHEEGQYLTEIKVTAILLKIKILLDYIVVANDETIISDIRALVNALSAHAKRQFLHPLLIESYMLTAHLDAIELKFDDAKNLMAFSEHLAMERGLIALAMKASLEHDKLLEYIEFLKEKEGTSLPSLRERILRSGITSQLCLVQNFCMPVIRDLPSEEPVFFAIFSEHGHPMYTRDFSQSPQFQELLVGTFLSALSTFAKQVLNQPLERAKLGRYKLLMHGFENYRLFYLFKGLSYPAQQKIEKIIEKIRKNHELLAQFKISYKNGSKIDYRSEEMLDMLINEEILEIE